MRSRIDHRLLIAAGLVLFLAGASCFLWRSRHLKSQATLVRVGMSRAEVEAILGPPYLELDRTGARGTLSSWVDHFWQVDVLCDPDGQVESVGCKRSMSFYNHTVDWIKSLAE